MSDAANLVRRLQDENHELRDLVNRMYAWFVGGVDGSSVCSDGARRWIEERMRELGMDVG